MENTIDSDYMRANICNGIRLIVDMQGASTHDVEESDISICRLLDSNLYERIEDTYTYEDINEWDKRAQRLVPNIVKRRLIESEKVICYESKDESEVIIIGKLYVEIKLTHYKSANLIHKMQLLQEIVEKYKAVNPFIRIDNIFLIKSNQIICKNLSALYNCFEAGAFGDIRAGIPDPEIVFTEFHSSSLVSLKKYSLTIEKSVLKGQYNNIEAYMGELNFSMSCQDEGNGECLDINSVMNDMNKKISIIFKKNLTNSFYDDLVNGRDGKTIGGVWKDEL